MIEKRGNPINETTSSCMVRPTFIILSSIGSTCNGDEFVQHFQYFPCEDFGKKRARGISSSYTFSSKERDTETGLSYFGSRYYSSDLNIWLSGPDE